jgi:oxygen-dependent protoporphyrinogen oxidase
MKAIIVGGGCAGLAAAHTIIKNGGEVLILEKEADPGGRMQNFKKDGFFLDLGAQYVHPGYKVARELMADVGILNELVDIKMDNIQMWRDGKWAFPKPYGSVKDKVKTAQWLAKFGPRGGINMERLVKFVLSRAPSIYEGSVDWFLDLEEEYFADFVKRRYSSNVLEYFVQPIISAITLADPEEIGMGFGLQIMWTILCGEAAVLKRGTGSLAEALIEECTSGNNRIVSGSPVKRIVIEKGRVKGVVTDQGTTDADVVICAAQATKALGMMPDLPLSLREPLSRVTYTPTINVMVAVDKVLSANGAAGGALPRKSGYPLSAILFNSMRSKSLVPEGCDSINCFVYGRNAYPMMELSDQQISNRVVGYLREVLPQMPKKVLFTKIARWPEANFLMPPGVCTLIKNLRDHHYRDVEGLFLCGEYMYTGSYESALASGRAAAEAAMGRRESI